MKLYLTEFCAWSCVLEDLLLPQDDLGLVDCAPQSCTALSSGAVPSCRSFSLIPLPRQHMRRPSSDMCRKASSFLSSEELQHYPFFQTGPHG